MSLWVWLLSRRRRMVEDLDQDIRNFVERETEENLERGMAPEEALTLVCLFFYPITRDLNLRMADELAERRRQFAA